MRDSISSRRPAVMDTTYLGHSELPVDHLQRRGARLPLIPTELHFDGKQQEGRKQTEGTGR